MEPQDGHAPARPAPPAASPGPTPQQPTPQQPTPQQPTPQPPTPQPPATSAPPASNEAVAVALQELASVGARLLAEHPDSYARVHAGLQQALSDIDDA